MRSDFMVLVKQAMLKKNSLIDWLKSIDIFLVIIDST